MEDRKERMKKAVQLLIRVVTDEELRESITKRSPEEITRVAAELGFDVTGEELLAAVRDIRRRALAALRPAAALAPCAG